MGREVEMKMKMKEMEIEKGMDVFVFYLVASLSAAYKALEDHDHA